MSSDRIEPPNDSRASLRLMLVIVAYVVGGLTTWLIFR